MKYQVKTTQKSTKAEKAGQKIKVGQNELVFSIFRLEGNLPEIKP